MKVFYSKWFPPKRFAAINLLGFIIGRKEYGELSEYEINHERIHTKQIVENIGVFFYIFYLLEWLIRCVQYGNAMTAYYNISYEREAYANDRNLNYLNKRKLFSSLYYLKKPK